MTPDVLSLARLIQSTARTFARRTSRQVDTRDLEQDAYLACLTALSRYDGSTKFSTFMRLRISGAMVDGLRRWEPRRAGRKRIVWIPIPDGAEASWPDNAVAPDETYGRSEVSALLTRLDPRSAFVLRRFYLDDQPLSVIATELGITPSGVSWLKSEALLALRHVVHAQL